MPTLAAPNRYAHLIEADELKKYTETFAAYDRDGGGEVDSLELGVMFRKLGHAVPDEAVFAPAKFNFGSVRVHPCRCFFTPIPASHGPGEGLRLCGIQCGAQYC